MIKYRIIKREIDYFLQRTILGFIRSEYSTYQRKWYFIEKGTYFDSEEKVEEAYNNYIESKKKPKIEIIKALN
jgi:hypothetical protein